MTEPKFMANPHALIKNGVCTQVIYMQDYDEPTIAETLAQHDYDEVIRWEDYGFPIYIGFHKFENKVVPHKPFRSWVLNEEWNDWVAPVPNPDLSMPYAWDESTVSWKLCQLCEENNTH